MEIFIKNYIKYSINGNKKEKYLVNFTVSEIVFAWSQKHL